jgi:CheY-like chemotaxis protein
MIVEDDNDIREDLKSLFELENYQVISSTDGRDALEKLAGNYPDLIVSDIMMPFVDGFELYEKVRTDFADRQIPFIFLSAKNDAASIRKGMNLGAEDYLTKPFSFDDLLNAVKIRIEKNMIYKDKLDLIKQQISKYVPHELRTPFVSILGFSGMILSEINNLNKSEIYDMVDKINFSGKKLLNRIEKFLGIIELESLAEGKMDERLLCASIETNIINSIMNNNYLLIESNNLFRIEIESQLVKIPQVYLNTVLNETLENAVKYSKPSSEIIVKGNCSNDVYNIVVTNYGVGMSSMELKEIDVFQQFGRDENERTGNGLGLILAKKITETFNGQFKIESTKNKFTSVFIDFPLLP